ncbi:hypothetical protein QQ054_26645 [Oscillatoria amoena NRMC-F 0135]|nr:hypothetical protein [Oscillatoria amoena NRMC-F 0135]
MQTDSSKKAAKIKLLDSAKTLKTEIAVIDEKVKHCQQFTIGKFFGAMGQASWWLRFFRVGTHGLCHFIRCPFLV